MMIMIHINRTMAYRLLTLVELAANPGRTLTKGEIAGRRKIPGSYLGQVVSALARAGLVVSRRGPRGGLKLARDPENIPLAEVLPHPRHDTNESPVLDHLDELLNSALRRTLEKLTLKDLLAWDRQAKATMNYVI